MVESVSTDDAPVNEDLPFSQAIVHGDTVYVSGQVGIDPATGDVVDGGIQAETRRTMENVGAILEAAGTSLDNVVKTTVFLDDVDDFAAFNEAYGEFVDDPLPARSAFEVGDLAIDIAVEIEVIAALPE
jgi:2-iminobutanoate/2-iminopropanoate deaminase